MAYISSSIGHRRRCARRRAVPFNPVMAGTQILLVRFLFISEPVPSQNAIMKTRLQHLEGAALHFHL
jgi:hypothetical protein